MAEWEHNKRKFYSQSTIKSKFFLSTYLSFREKFEQAYEHQVETDIKQLKSIGELKHNFGEITQKIMENRNVEFEQIQS